MKLIKKIDSFFYILYPKEHDYFNILIHDNKIYNVKLINYTINDIDNSIKNNEISLFIMINELTNKLLLWFRKNGKYKLKHGDVSYYSINDKDKCINVFKSIFYNNTGYKWEDYDYNSKYNQMSNKYKIQYIDHYEVNDYDIKSKVIKTILKYDNTNNKNKYELCTSDINKDNVKTILDLLCRLKSDTTNKIIIKELTENVRIISNNNINLTEDDVEYFIKEIKLSDYHYLQPCDIPTDLYHNLVETTDAEYDIIKKYVLINKGKTLSHSYNLNVLGIFKYNNKKEFKNDDSTCYLFHGSRFSNIYSILNLGLKIAPNNIIRTGLMLGDGLYFANCSTKSYNYCNAHLYNNTGCLLLCRVSLGVSLKISQLSQYHNITIKNKYQSVKGVGVYTPKTNKNICKLNGVSIPIGKLDINECYQNPYLLYDEIVVYDENRVCVDYIVFFSS